MPRGRQYYDPILQVPGTVPAADDLSRIELYPEIVGEVITRWCARRIHPDGKIAEEISGSADHDEVLHRAQQTWPGLEVFELKSEGEDSTHEGMGPSPRLWQSALPEEPIVKFKVVDTETGEEVTDQYVSGPPFPPDLPPAVAESRQIRAFVAEQPGAYVLIEDVVLLLEDYAVQYDEQGNPSGALALREAAAALREPF